MLWCSAYVKQCYSMRTLTWHSLNKLYVNMNYEIDITRACVPNEHELNTNM